MLKFARVATELERFKSSCDEILLRMIKQGGAKNRIRQCLCEISRRDFEVFR